MNPRFQNFLEGLEPSFNQLMNSRPITNGVFTGELPKAGIYLFTENGRHLYVGRSNDIRGRYGRHCNPGATHRMAAFAFRLAREATGRVSASYKPGPESRAGLVTDPIFLDAFERSKSRIRAMEFRSVDEADPIRQYLLELYAAIALDTPYNDFDNH